MKGRVGEGEVAVEMRRNFWTYALRFGEFACLNWLGGLGTHSRRVRGVGKSNGAVCEEGEGEEVEESGGASSRNTGTAVGRLQRDCSTISSTVYRACTPTAIPLIPPSSLVSSLSPKPRGDLVRLSITSCDGGHTFDGHNSPSTDPSDIRQAFRRPTRLIRRRGAGAVMRE